MFQRQGKVVLPNESARPPPPTGQKRSRTGQFLPKPKPKAEEGAEGKGGKQGDGDGSRAVTPGPGEEGTGGAVEYMLRYTQLIHA
jgi:hypothetical protein